MAIELTPAPIETALWQQGDARDPLGVWGLRQIVTGDASGGGIKVTARVLREKASAYVYTCYAVTIVELTGAIIATSAKCRLLTVWPNVDPVAGVQAYASYNEVTFNGNALFTSPVAGAQGSLIRPNDRFLLLYDPRSQSANVDIVELELGRNVLAETYSFEMYGYFWDRSVMNAPGGPRHPGSA